MRPGPKHHNIALQLPPLTAEEALLLLHIFEELSEALWRLHGDEMENLLTVKRLENPQPEGPMLASHLLDQDLADEYF